MKPDLEGGKKSRWEEVKENWAALPLTTNERKLLVFVGLTGIAGLTLLAWREHAAPEFHPYVIAGTPRPASELEWHPDRVVARPTVPFPLDLNRADPFQLQLLPGIGKKLAYRIADDRKARGRFRTVDDLVRVKGVTRKKIEALRPFAVVALSQTIPARAPDAVLPPKAAKSRVSEPSPEAGEE